MGHRYSGAMLVLMMGCGRTGAQADQITLLQEEIEKLQLRIQELETEAIACNTTNIQEGQRRANCEAD